VRLRYRAGDRVGLFATNCTQYLECLYGIWWIGAVAIPINAKLHGREAAWILGDGGAKLVFISDDTAAALAEAKSDLPAAMKTLSVDSDAYRKMGEGGGTAVAANARGQRSRLAVLYLRHHRRPKGVMLSHGNLVAMSLCYLSDVDPATPNDASLYAAPISHGAGLYNFPHVRMGGRHVIPESGGFDPDEVLNLGRQLDNVVMFAAPTMVRAGWSMRQETRRERRGAAHHHLWRRADVYSRHPGRDRHHGPAFCADLRPG